MSLFDGFNRKNTSFDEILTNEENVNTSQTLPISKDNDGYYFENINEFLTFAKLYGKSKPVSWRDGDNLYLIQCKIGYDLFEQRRYIEAIEAYKKSLTLNPIGIRARFEICEANIQLNNLKEAKQALLEMKDLLIDGKDIARFYRRMGYIETENGNYNLAVACYQYSLQFENHPSVVNELAYIETLRHIDNSSDNIVKTLSLSGIPLLSIENNVYDTGIKKTEEDDLYTICDEYEYRTNDATKNMFISKTWLDTATFVVRRMKSGFCCNESVTLLIDDEVICKMDEEESQELVICLGMHTIEIIVDFSGEVQKTAFDISIDDSDTYAFEFILGEEGRVININA